MANPVRCSRCGQTIDGDKQSAKEFRCKFCGATVLISPAFDESPARSPTNSSTSRARVSCVEAKPPNQAPSRPVASKAGLSAREIILFVLTSVAILMFLACGGGIWLAVSRYQQARQT